MNDLDYQDYPNVSSELLDYVGGMLDVYDPSWYLWSGIPEDGTVILAHQSVTTIVLHRDGQFQTELVIMHPNAPEWPGEHRHPHVESIEGALYDCLGVTKNGAVVTRPDGKLGHIPLVHLAPTDWHRSPSKPHGSALLSFQRWADGYSPTSVGLDWEGEPSHPSHAAQHADHGNTADNAPTDGTCILLHHHETQYIGGERCRIGTKWSHVRWTSDKVRTGSEPHWEEWLGHSNFHTTAIIPPEDAIGWLKVPTAYNPI